MSLIHKESQECMKSELDLFEVPPTQRNIESGQWVEYYPISTIGTGPIEFNVKGSGEEYMDLSQTFLYVKCRILKADGTGLDLTKDVCGPSNLFLHSLFSQVDVSLNDTLVTSAINTYPYRAMIETLVNQNSEAKSTHLTSALFYQDNNHELQEIDTSKPINYGWIKRRSFFASGKSVDMFGRIGCDIYYQNRYLINNVSMKVRLTRSRDSFCLIGADGFKVVIDQAILLVRKVKINPEIMLAHAKVLEITTAKYPIKRVLTKVITIPSNHTSLIEDNISNGPLPNRIVFCMVASEAYNGNFQRNPFNFQNYDLNRISFEIDGKETPYKALELDYTNNNFVRAFYSMFNGIDRGMLDSGNGINREQYKFGNNLFCFDFTGDLCSSSNFNLLKSGNLRLNLVFTVKLPEAVNCIIYMEYDNVIEINKSRQVFFDYTI